MGYIKLHKNEVCKFARYRLSTDAGKSKLKWAEDLRMYKSHGIKPISALKGKILSKIPQFIEARLPWSEIPEAEEESLIQPAAANKKE